MNKTTFRGSIDEMLRHLLGITKQDNEKYHGIRRKTGAQNVVK